MANILIGDVHGCYEELRRVLEKADFEPCRDTLWFTGDLVARGPDSLNVLRFIHSIKDHVRLCLGNHDLHLLAIYAGISKNKRRDNLEPLLNAPDYDELMNWLRRQPIMQIDEQLKLIMVHAGISAQWDLDTAKQCARNLEAMLSSDSYAFFLNAMYGDLPDFWREDLQGIDRLRYSANVFTRMRYCYLDGRLDLNFKEAPEDAPAKLKPWFMLPRKIPDEYSIAFGHWASLNGKGTPDKIYALDTGCCWGGKLTALRWEDQQYFKKRKIKQKD
ncbi:bis(5'-nucleosyl)-tetraphosphatase (symmetrical) ApaH [Utexia brackfieldae]|uniref:bis(5'-nucleosyl)-tetraphosphatase (symmetrical) ApaH n=1 Tax=Utexia brackfieldae TaxID=3074108 RepID=UPI00370D0E2A